MNYKKILRIIIGCFLILCSIITLFQTITWQLRKKDYNKEYVYSDLGDLYYEKNNEKIYIERIYNTDGEELQLKVPNKKTIIMYCYKDKPTEGIYLGMNNTPDASLQYPIVNICVALFILAVAFFILLKKNEENPIHRYYLLYIFLLFIGIVMIVYSATNIINYYSIKNDNNIVNATIYSDIYETGIRNEKYKAVSYYYVDGIKYIYVDETYTNGNIGDVLGTTQKLYYDSNNPERVPSKINFVTILFLIIGIFMAIISFPIVFLKNKMAERYNEAVRENVYNKNKK